MVQQFINRVIDDTKLYVIYNFFPERIKKSMSEPGVLNFSIQIGFLAVQKGSRNGLHLCCKAGSI